MSTDLFGDPESAVPLPAVRDPQAPRAHGKNYVVPRGYAARPGGGPAGETCRSCRHMARIRYAKTYRKCDLCRANWSRGPRTDVLARSPACAFWAAITPKEKQPFEAGPKP